MERNQLKRVERASPLLCPVTKVSSQRPHRDVVASTVPVLTSCGDMGAHGGESGSCITRAQAFAGTVDARCCGHICAEVTWQRVRSRVAYHERKTTVPPSGQECRESNEGRDLQGEGEEEAGTCRGGARAGVTDLEELSALGRSWAPQA